MPKEEAKGIGGWLILIIIWLVFSILTGAYTTYESIEMYLGGTVSELLQGTSDEPYLQHMGILKLQTTINALVLLFEIYITYLLFRKSNKFPKYMISLIYILIGYGALNAFLVPQLISGLNQNSVQEFMQNISPYLFWGAYIAMSKRVKNTFVE